MYGLFVCDIGSAAHEDNEFGNRANIVEKRLPRRVTPLHYGVRYHDQPLEFSLIFGAEKYLDRYEMQAAAMWLTGYQKYQWLSIDQPDLAHLQFRCLITSLTPVSVRWLPVALEAKVVCDCPYGYSYPFQKEISFDDNKRVVFYNDSTVREKLRPDLKIELSAGCTQFAVSNKTTGSEARFTGLPSEGVTILMDNENGVVTDGNGAYDLYEYFNFQFFDLASGDNELVFTGKGKATVSGRYLYNVGA